MYLLMSCLLENTEQSTMGTRNLWNRKTTLNSSTRHSDCAVFTDLFHLIIWFSFYVHNYLLFNHIKYTKLLLKCYLSIPQFSGSHCITWNKNFKKLMIYLWTGWSCNWRRVYPRMFAGYSLCLSFKQFWWTIYLGVPTRFILIDLSWVPYR